MTGWRKNINAEAPRDGTPIIVLDDDGSGEMRLAWLTINGDSGWWELKADEKPDQSPYSGDEPDFDNYWITLPDALLENAKEFRDGQYNPDRLLLDDAERLMSSPHMGTEKWLEEVAAWKARKDRATD